jgi:hypothetical protein
VLPPIFVAFDSDSDGFLTRADVATLLEHATAALVALAPVYFMQCSVAQHHRSVHAAKRTATDSIGEVVAKTNESNNSIASQIMTLRRVLQHRIDTLFALLDRDCDGRVSAAEFETWFAPRESIMSAVANRVSSSVNIEEEPECALTALFDLRVWGIVTDTTALTEELEHTKQGVESVLNCLRSGELDIVNDDQSRVLLLKGYEEQYFCLLQIRVMHQSHVRHFCTKLRHTPTLVAQVIEQQQLSPDATASDVEAVVSQSHDSARLVIVVDECVQMTVQVLEALGGAAPTYTLTSSLLAAAIASASAGMPAAAPALRRAVSAERAIAAAAAITALMCESEGEGEGVASASAVAAASDSVAALSLTGEGESDGESGHNGAGSHRVDADAAAALHEEFIRLVVADATVRAVEGDEGFEMRTQEMRAILARLSNYFGTHLRHVLYLEARSPYFKLLLGTLHCVE